MSLLHMRDLYQLILTGLEGQVVAVAEFLSSSLGDTYLNIDMKNHTFLLSQVHYEQ